MSSAGRHASEPSHAYVKSLEEEVEQLRTSKKTVEQKLHLLTQQYEEELRTFNQTKIEHILKNSGAKEYLQKLKAGNNYSEQSFKILKEELDFKTKEITKLRNQLRDQERKNSQRRVKSPKSFIESHNNIPPPPPLLQIPSFDEFLQFDGSSNNSMTSELADSTIPPPPPVEAPYDMLSSLIK